MRHCDLTVKLNSDVEHTFTAINKDELPAIKSYLKTRNVRVKEQADDVGMRDPTKMDLGDDDDEDMSDVEEDDDGGKTRARAGGDDDSGKTCFVALSWR
jgi:structure-specific recognition protein 1